MQSDRKREQTGAGVDRWVAEQHFEEDVRAVLNLMRPNRRERLLGWDEYRAGGAGMRVTVSWDPAAVECPENDPLAVPDMAQVLETLLIGSAKSEANLTGEEEFELYRQVALDLLRRVEEARASQD